MRLLFLFLFMLVSFIGKAQMLPINRTKIMRPIDPPRKTTCKFSDGIGKTIVVTKYIEGLDYNVYSKRLVNAASRGDVKAQFALWYLYYHGQGVAGAMTLQQNILKWPLIMVWLRHCINLAFVI